MKEWRIATNYHPEYSPHRTNSSRINAIKEYVAEISSRSKQYMPRKFAEMSSKFRFGQEFVEKLGISSTGVCITFAQYCMFAGVVAAIISLSHQERRIRCQSQSPYHVTTTRLFKIMLFSCFYDPGWWIWNTLYRESSRYTMFQTWGIIYFLASLRNLPVWGE